jgi:hypothetical protein
MWVHLTSARSRRSPGNPASADEGKGELVIAGAHGGAGATTFAILLQPAWDIGMVRPPRTWYPALSSGGRPLVLVSRNTVRAARQAIAAVNIITDSREHVAVLAVISDGLPEPLEAAYRFRVLSARVGSVVRVPFIASLRVTDDPGKAQLPRKARRALREIRAAAFKPTTEPTHATTP